MAKKALRQTNHCIVCGRQLRATGKRGLCDACYASARRIMIRIGAKDWSVMVRKGLALESRQGKRSEQTAFEKRFEESQKGKRRS